MKKLVVITLAVALIGVLGAEAYAYYAPRGGMYGHRRGMMYGPRGGTMYGPGWMQGRVPGQAETAQQMITEDKAKETAETFVAKYLPGYTIDKIEKDNWRPLYFVTLKGENDAELQLVIYGLDGKIMHLFPIIVEKPAE